MIQEETKAEWENERKNPLGEKEVYSLTEKKKSKPDQQRLPRSIERCGVLWRLTEEYTAVSPSLHTHTHKDMF